ncbi:Clc chloride channel [Paramyrothecium foliicola]|nr:Clc chloride channel [Paramyrothecium foliicola]
MDNDCQAWKTWSEIANIDNGRGVSYVVNFAIYSTFVVLLSMMSHVVTRCSKTARFNTSSLLPLEDGGEADGHQHYFAAAGSGVLDVKRKLWGVREDAPWKVSTFFFKAVGLIMSTSSGLSVGKEGPYIHLSAMVANLINTSFTPDLRLSTQTTLSLGSATGMAVAFGAPLTGALFVMEDFCQVLDARNMATLIGGGVVACISLSTMNPYGDNKVVPWQVVYTTKWSWIELPVFVLIGVAAGILSAFFIKAVRVWSTTWRQLAWIKRRPSLDVLLIALLTASTSFWAKHLRFGTAELLSDLTSSRESLFSHPPVAALVPLAAALSIKFVLTIVTFGLQIPQGIYMPSMAMGALLGRFVGQMVLLLPQRSLLGLTFQPNPAVYAMAGAGAVAAGVTRLQFCIVAITFETTRSWEYAILFAASIVVAKAVGDYLEPLGIYDLVATLQGQKPVDEVLKSSDACVDDVWEPQISRTPSLNLVSGFLTHIYSLEMLLEVAEISGSQWLPILKQRRLVGCVSIASFRQALRNFDDSLAIVLTQKHPDTLTLHVAVEDETPSSRFITLEEEPRGTSIEISIDHPVIFESCSTLGAMQASFRRPDVRYVCVARQGVSWTVVTREMLAEWARRRSSKCASEVGGPHPRAMRQDIWNGAWAVPVLTGRGGLDIRTDAKRRHGPVAKGSLVSEPSPEYPSHSNLKLSLLQRLLSFLRPSIPFIMSSADSLNAIADSFPSVKPAFKIELVGITAQYPCGDVFTGGTLVAVPFSKGIVESVGDFEPKFKFNITTGVDFFRIDADKSHGRLHVRVVLTDEEGRSVILNGDGVTKINEHILPILMGDPSAKTSPWGFSVEHIKFEAGHEYYKPLEGMLFAGSQRFFFSPEGIPGVQVRASQIISGTGEE